MLSFRNVLILVLCATLCSCATLRRSQDAFYFIQMSDPQFGMFNEDKSFEEETLRYTKAIAEANRLKPAFVVVTGDLVNKPSDSTQIAEYKRISSQLSASVPLYSVPGNHDVQNMPVPSDIAAYKKNFGPDYYTFTHGSMLGIVLNSLYLQAPQHVPEQALEQEKWLRTTLEEAAAKRYRHIIVFLHHPFFLKEEQEADQYFNIPLSTRKKYLDLFKAHGIRHIFAGHYHRNAFGKAENIEMITTGPVGKPLGKDPSGFRIVTIKGDKLRHQYYSLDSIPSNVPF